MSIDHCNMPQRDTDESPLEPVMTTFRSFNHLPPELRHRIWQFTFEPRVHNVTFGRTGDYDDLRIMSPPPPVALSVNTESRHIALLVGVMIPAGPYPGGYCHKTLDIIHVPELCQRGEWNQHDIPFGNISLEFNYALGMQLPSLLKMAPYRTSLVTTMVKLSDKAPRAINITILLDLRDSLGKTSFLESPPCLMIEDKDLKRAPQEDDESEETPFSGHVLEWKMKLHSKMLKAAGVRIEGKLPTVNVGLQDDSKVSP